MKILGVKIDDVSKQEIMRKATDWIQSGKQSYFVTIGPEFILTAQRDADFKKILNEADLAIPEGYGLQLYAGIKNRIPGTDLMLSLCSEATKSGWTVGLLGGEEGVAKKTRLELEKQFSGIKIEFALDGEEADKIIGSAYKLLKNPKSLKPYSCDLLFVAFGHPKQEKLIYKLIEANQKRIDANTLVNFKVAMGVGGAFDYISGNIPRAPKWVRDIGMEWMVRLIREPKRIKRIFNATVIFPLILIRERRNSR